MQFTCQAASSHYSRILFKEFFKYNWFWFVLPLAFFGCLSLIDVRFVIVTGMVLLIVIPMVMSLLYINFMMTLTTRWSIIEKTVTVEKDALLLTATDGRQCRIPFERVKRFFPSLGYICLELTERKYPYLIIPVSVFEGDVARLHSFLSLFGKKLEFLN